MPSLDRLHHPVLVLNASYEPINVCAARRALVLVLKGVARAEESSVLIVHGHRHNPRNTTIKTPVSTRMTPQRSWAG